MRSRFLLPLKILLPTVVSLVLIFSASPALAQFGSGLQPIVENAYTEGVIANNTNALTTLELFISNMLGLGTVVGSIIFIAYFLLGAISWIGAGGDSSKINKARDQMIQGAVGLIVLVAMYAIVGLIGTIVGLDILNPATVLYDLIPTQSATP